MKNFGLKCLLFLWVVFDPESIPDYGSSCLGEEGELEEVCLVLREGKIVQFAIILY